MTATCGTRDRSSVAEEVERRSPRGTAGRSRRRRRRRSGASSSIDLDELAHEEHAELHARVLGEVAGGELALALGHVERDALGLGDGRREEQEERQRLDEDAPQVQALGRTAWLTLPVDHVLEQQRVVDHEAADQRQAERDLVADHLARGAHAAEQRVLVVATSSRRWPRPPRPCRAMANTYSMPTLSDGDLQRDDRRHSNGCAGRAPSRSVVEVAACRRTGSPRTTLMAGTSAMIGASACSSLSAFGGMKSSFHMNFNASASGCSKPSSAMFLPPILMPARMRTDAVLDHRALPALGPDQHRRERQDDEQHEHDLERSRRSRRRHPSDLASCAGGAVSPALRAARRAATKPSGPCPSAFASAASVSHAGCTPSGGESPRA